MPLKKGKSKKVMQKNIAEVMDKYNMTGEIGTSKPKTKKAVKQAVAIAYSMKKKSNKSKK